MALFCIVLIGWLTFGLVLDLVRTHREHSWSHWNLVTLAGYLVIVAGLLLAINQD